MIALVLHVRSCLLLVVYLRCAQYMLLFACCMCFLLLDTLFSGACPVFLLLFVLTNLDGTVSNKRLDNMLVSFALWQLLWPTIAAYLGLCGTKWPKLLPSWTSTTALQHQLPLGCSSYSNQPQ